MIEYSKINCGSQPVNSYNELMPTEKVFYQLTYNNETSYNNTLLILKL